MRRAMQAAAGADCLSGKLQSTREHVQDQSLAQLAQLLISAALQRLSERLRDLCWRETTVREDVHPVMKEFNIYTGYRHTGRSWRYYLGSAFQLHNETLNWLTHAIGGIVVLTLTILWTLQLPESADARDVQLAWLFCFTSVLLQAASSVAHLLHNKSELSHCMVFFADNAAVGLSGYGNNLISVAFLSSPGYYSWIGPVTLPVLMFGAISLSTSYSLALAAYRRRYSVVTSLLMFGPSGCCLLFGMVPVIERQLLQMRNTDNQQSDLLGVPHYVVFCLAVACYAAYFPERWWPGKFDLVGHSHQLFHVLVTTSHCILLGSVFGEIERDGATLFSKRPGDWITVQASVRGIAVASVFSVAVVVLYARAFCYNSDFKSRAARSKRD